MRNVKGRCQFIFTAILTLAVIPAVIVMPGQVQAFGGPTENGTAAYMGIGSSPHAIRPLYVFGNAPLFERAQDSAGFIIQRTNSNRWVLGVNEDPGLGNGFVLSTYPVGEPSSTARLLVTPDGRVGIGTTSPAYKLNVDGTAGASYAMTAPYFYDWSDSDYYLDPMGNSQGISMILGHRAGIGTVSPRPNTELHVFSDNTTAGHAAIYGETTEGNTAGVVGYNAKANTLGFIGGKAFDIGAGAFGGCYYDNSTTLRTYGTLGRWGYAVYGESAADNAYAMYAKSAGPAIAGVSTGGYTAIYGESNGSGYGVYGKNASANVTGYLGSTAYGVRGDHEDTGAYGYLGGHYYGVYGSSGSSGSGAGYFDGNVDITGDLHFDGIMTGGTKSFKIDHPQDPENKYLSHSVIESPDMMNVYNGNIILDDKGEATVQMPAYFEALNCDFRYQLTAIGAPGPDLYIAAEIAGNSFKIAGGKPGMKVSWMVTGIRKDAFASAHPVIVEQEKPAGEKGYYLHPAEWGQPAEKGIASLQKK